MGYSSRKFVAILLRCDVPMYVAMQGGSNYRLEYDLGQATLWNFREDVEKYFSLLFPGVFADQQHFRIYEVDLKVIREGSAQ